MERDTAGEKFPIGSRIPTFSLPNVDGQQLGSEYLLESSTGRSAAALVAFTCNHCPYVKGSEDKLIELVKLYEPRGLKAIAISSNDALQYPDDSFDKMKEKSKQMKLPYPYLYDETQQVARLFDAACTPELYLFDRAGKLVYHGAINDSPRDPTKVTKEYLRDAIEAVIAGEQPAKSFINPLGCSIKWK